MFRYDTYSYPQHHVEVQTSSFQPEEGVTEHHLMLHITDATLSYAAQAAGLHKALADVLHTVYKEKAHPVLKRYFLTDAANQAEPLRNSLPDNGPYAVSILQQPPLDGSKIALWVYLVEGMDEIVSDGHTSDSCICRHNGYSHHWDVCRPHRTGNSEEQTRVLLEDYESHLESQDCNIADHCVRTWFFVRDVDVNYSGVVKGRKENFLQVGLTRESHYIASTGIEGGHADPTVKVQLEAYAIKGIKPGQMTYLYAPTHLNPTYEYGVTFERGTCIDYGDRRHVFISGTASINNKGEVMHPGDIRQQTLRMWENVETLLAEADCTFDNATHLIVYLRDMADYTVVRRLYEERFPSTPTVFLLAPVCRPGWLIEMECMAVKRMKNADYPAM